MGYPLLTMRLQSAEAAIAEVLRSLEADTGQLVEALDLETYDLTTTGNPTPHHQMRVRIDLKRMPVRSWKT